MDRRELDSKIVQASHTIFTWCMNRTPNRSSAEDLAQDILCELIRSLDSLRDERAFYGFMWGVARNVYRQWCRRRQWQFVELTDNMASELTDESEANAMLREGGFGDEQHDIARLRRELALLSARYRNATVLYYLDGKSCAEIAKALSISESMVKYLLFKARKILREGMDMERNYGKQSYAPRGMGLMFWGGPTSEYYHLCDSKIAQNILLACYNDALTDAELSLEMGVALPYIEDDMAALLEHDLLIKAGSRYSTNIIIFTDKFTRDVNVKTAALRGEIVGIVRDTVLAHGERARRIGFDGVEMNENTLRWQLTCMLLYRAVIGKLQSRIKLEYPVTKHGEHTFIWGEESGEASLWSGDFAFGISNVSDGDTGDEMQYMDFPINGPMVHHYFFDRPAAYRLMFAIARGAEPVGDNDRALAAELVELGYAVGVNGLHVNAPVLGKAQFESIMELFESAADVIADSAEKLMGEVERILIDHTPVKLRAQTGGMAYLRLFTDAISAPVAMLYEEGFLRKAMPGEMLPTTYIKLNS